VIVQRKNELILIIYLLDCLRRAGISLNTQQKPQHDKCRLIKRRVSRDSDIDGDKLLRILKIQTRQFLLIRTDWGILHRGRQHSKVRCINFYWYSTDSESCGKLEEISRDSPRQEVDLPPGSCTVFSIFNKWDCPAGQIYIYPRGTPSDKY
jgi:hypothetical protein